MKQAVLQMEQTSGFERYGDLENDLSGSLLQIRKARWS